MSNIDDSLYENAERIERYFQEVNKENREEISVDTLPIVRSFCEAVMYKVYDVENNCDLYQTQDNLRQVRKYIKGKYKSIDDFHCQLDAGPGHKYVSKKNAESLLLKYLPSLFELRNILKKVSKIDTLKSLNNYPLDIDESLMSFYEKIYAAIINQRYKQTKRSRNLYFVRKKSFKCINGKIFYEYVMDVSDDKNNKFNTFVVYSLKNIRYTYDLRFNIIKDDIKFLDTKITINILNDYEYYIRPCCFDNLLFLLNYEKKNPKRTNEYFNIMTIIKERNVSLYELIKETNFTIKNPNDYYGNFINICRNFIKNNKFGNNLIKLLLCSMRNDIIKAQISYNKQENSKFNNLRISTGSLSFELMPYAFNPKGTITNFETLNEIIDCNDSIEYQAFYTNLTNYINEKNELFVKPKDIGYDEVQASRLVKLFNDKLISLNEFYADHKIVNFNGYYTIEFYYKETIKILKIIGSYLKSNVSLNKSKNPNLSSIQKEIIEHCFDKSHIAFVTGSAGTGKTTIIKEIIENNQQLKILCLTITNTALNNLKTNTYNVTYLNIKNFENQIQSISDSSYDIVIIDEASFVPTKSIFKILNKFINKNILIVGDTEQIESIEFGNWFKLAIEFYNDKNFIYSLSDSYRTNCTELQSIWNEVRNKHSEKLLELLSTFNMSSKLTDDVFKNNNGEIVLCLNYDGLYGINNVNRYLQAKNPNRAYTYQENIYKINDPIIFIVNEYDYLGVYNNLNGKIIDISENESQIMFMIEIDKALYDVTSHGELSIVKIEDNKTIISIAKYKDYSEQDETDISLKTKLPFQISYAMSIHKAQGLEFENVKIIITKESDEQINKNIFYTAITRAKKNLKIYWEPEVANEISNMLNNDETNKKRDLKILEKIMKSK